MSAEVKARLAALEAVFAALAHPARRHVLLVVWFRGGSMSAGDIAARFDHSWPTTSRHLGVLTAAGLLVQERHGRTRSYRVDQARLDVVRGWLRWFDEQPGDRAAKPVATPHKPADAPARPTRKPAARPTRKPAARPTRESAARPTRESADVVAARPTREPAAKPTREPADVVAARPTRKPAARPTRKPSARRTKPTRKVAAARR